MLLKNILLYIIRTLNRKNQVSLNNLLLKKMVMMIRIKILMKNLEVGKIMISRSYLIIFKKIFHPGLKEIKPNFTMKWLEMFCQTRNQLQLKVGFFNLKRKDFNRIFAKLLLTLINYFR